MSEVSITVTNRMDIALLPRAPPSIRSPTVTRDIQPIKRFAGLAYFMNHLGIVYHRAINADFSAGGGI